MKRGVRASVREIPWQDGERPGLFDLPANELDGVDDAIDYFQFRGP